MQENLDVQETQETQPSQESKSQTSKSEPIKAKRDPITVDDKGLIAPKNANELVYTIEQIAKGGGFPRIFDTKEKQIAGYNLARTLMGNQWQLALNNMYFVKGKLCIFGELPGTLAERTKEVEEKHVFLIDRDYKVINVENQNLQVEPWASVCRIKRKGRLLKEFTYTMDEAIAAGQYPPKKADGSVATDSPWYKHTRIMLMRKAMNTAIKIEFPESLVGVPIAEYDFDEAPDLRDVSETAPAEDKGAILNKRFKKVKPEVMEQ